MRKIISMTLLLAVLLSIVSCADNSGDPAVTTDGTTGIIADITTDDTADIITSVITDVTTSPSVETPEDPNATAVIEKDITRFALGSDNGSKEALDIFALNKTFGVVIEKDVYINGIELEFASAGTFEIAVYEWDTNVETTVKGEVLDRIRASSNGAGVQTIDLPNPLPGKEKLFLSFENASEGLSLVKAGKAEGFAWKEDNISKNYGISGNLLHIEYIYHDDSTVIYQLDKGPDTKDGIMSYIIKTKNNKFIVIDGGRSTDNAYVLDFLKRVTRQEIPEIEAWILTHAHADHIAVFHVFGNKNFVDVKINNVYHKITDLEFAKAEGFTEVSIIEALHRSFGKLDDGVVKEVKVGDVITVDNVSFDILYVTEDNFKNPNSSQTYFAVNNASMVFKMSSTDSDKTVLFTGDIMGDAGRYLAKKYTNGELEADYVQMAHHGQDAVDNEFYDLVKPTYCLWPTPDNLQTNSLEKTEDYMEDELGIGIMNHFKAHYGRYAIIFD